MFVQKAARAAGGLIVAALLSATAVPSFADEAGTQPQQVVAELDQTLLSVMQNAQKLGLKGRYEKLLPVVQQSFDLPLMTRIAVGPGWSELTPDQQKQLSDAFGKFIAATYAERFDGYSGEKFVEKGVRPAGAGSLVDTQLVKPDGSAVDLDYVTRPEAGQTKIVDVYLTGTISELATRRSEFSAVYQRAGYAGLLQTLQQKTVQLQATRVG